ncbi:MAG: hypothetical protein DBY23_03305 [Bacillota bacterium]|nr:MAG: hypothetical protein DBY23_03305 [Bacillota bacterium]
MNNEELLVTQSNEFNFSLKYFYFVIKRIFDIFFGILGMIILLPLSIVIKVLYLVQGDFDSIFYCQERVGKYGKIFRLYKFRTMVPNAENILADWLKNNPDKRKEYLKNRKIEDDPRITKFGRFLRKSSLDEFPQFINVFLGHMSLVGPRPVVLDEVENYKKNKAKFLSIRPGLTGFWASNGRSNVSYKKRMQMELYYVDHCSIFLDIKIIFRTFIKVLKREGAK